MLAHLGVMVWLHFVLQLPLVIPSETQQTDLFFLWESNSKFSFILVNSVLTGLFSISAFSGANYFLN